MHTEIFNKNQIEIIEHLKMFNRNFYLVGGTAIALYIGHRRSIDFDFFSYKPIIKHQLKKKLLKIPFQQIPIFEDVDQLHLLINSVKITFFYYPYPVNHSIKNDSIFSIPSLLSLAAMKAFALGRRAKWKDYVDLYFILKNHYSIEEISNECEKIFGNQYSEKLFRQQLAFHNDIDFSESVDFLTGPISENEIKEFLIEEAIRFL
jgi:hypothetical protein